MPPGGRDCWLPHDFGCWTLLAACWWSGVDNNNNGQVFEDTTDGQVFEDATDGQVFDDTTDGQVFDDTTDGQVFEDTTDGQVFDYTTDCQMFKPAAVVVKQAQWVIWGELGSERRGWKGGQLGIVKYWKGLAKGWEG